jgi:hypothetical protein
MSKPYRFKSDTRTRQEQSFSSKLQRQIKRSKLSPLEKAMSFPLFVPRQDLTRYLTRYEIYKKIINVHGSIVECGVLFGAGAMLWAHLTSIFEPLNHSRTVLAFDTYEGFPETSVADSIGKSGECKTGGFSVDAYAEIQAVAALHDSNRPIGHIPRIELVRGDACETIPEYVQSHPELIVSLLVLDFDIEKPTYTALKYLLPRVPRGGIVAFDELGLKAWPGESQALLRHTIGNLNGLRIQRFPWGSTMCYAEVE